MCLQSRHVPNVVLKKMADQVVALPMVLGVVSAVTTRNIHGVMAFGHADVSAQKLI